MTSNLVLQGSSVCPRLWDDASVRPRVWLRPTTEHPPQPSTPACDEPKPHPQLSHSVEVLLQRQFWLEGILRGEPFGAFICVCSGAFRLCEQDARHISFAHINQLSSDGVDLEKQLSCTQTTCFCNTAFYPCVTFLFIVFAMATFDLQVKWKNAEVTCRKW